MHRQQDVELAVPSKGFIREYYNWARLKNPAIPPIFHVAAAYALASSLINYDPRIAVPSDDRPTSLWVLAVGKSGSGKSTSINMARAIYEDATGSPPPALPSTAEGLYQSAQRSRVASIRPQRSEDNKPFAEEGGEADIEHGDHAVLRYWEDDLGKMLASSARKQGYAAAVRGALLQFYDGQSREETLATKVYRAPRNRTTLCAGVTPAQISRDTDTAEWETGFFSRFTFFYHDGTMEPAMPARPDAELEAGRDRLVTLAKHALAHTSIAQKDPYQPEIGLDFRVPWYLTSLKGHHGAFDNEETKRAYEYIRNHFVEREQDASRYAKGPIQRATDMCMRACALIQWSQPYSIHDWRIRKDTLQTAFALTRLHVASAKAVAAQVSADPFNRLCADIMDVMGHLAAEGMLFVPVSRIHQELKRMDQRYPIRRVEEAMNQIVLSGDLFVQASAVGSSGLQEHFSLRPFDDVSLPQGAIH